jgi:hypothetical protein
VSKLEQLLERLKPAFYPEGRTGLASWHLASRSCKPSGGYERALVQTLVVRESKSAWCKQTAARHNPILRAFYQRVAGKPANVALTATMRKLLIVLNSALKPELTYA